MRAAVFTGPSLPPREAAIRLDAHIFGPARRGDVYRSARDGASIIALIDGYFEAEPAVLHKEILWAMHRGVHVLGAASLGALRAAELHSFGMRGTGRVFEAFRDGRLNGDDEVALIFAPDRAGYAALSEPLVNIRATLTRAIQVGVIQTRDAARLIEIARARFFKERTFDRLFADAATELNWLALDALKNWLPTGYVDQKRLDACALLDFIANNGGILEEPLKPSFSFVETQWWISFISAAQNETPADA